MLQFFIICALFFINDVLTQYCEAEDQYKWSYHGPSNGPYYWEDDYPDCRKKDQSPIDIQYRNIINLKLPKLEYNNFNTPITNATVQNVGWTVIVTPRDDVYRYIRWGQTIYTLSEIHFHFGSESAPGAENVLAGVRYSVEVHYVTHEDKHRNRVAVVAALMKATNDQNSGFDPIIEVLYNIPYRHDTTDLESELNLSGLLPQDSGSYYYYVGSNSIPPCEPGIVWWILKGIGKVGNEQLDEFMTLYSVGETDASDSCRMGPNYRPVQDLDNRPIISSK